MRKIDICNMYKLTFSLSDWIKKEMELSFHINDLMLPFHFMHSFMWIPLNFQCIFKAVWGGGDRELRWKALVPYFFIIFLGRKRQKIFRQDLFIWKNNSIKSHIIENYVCNKFGTLHFVTLPVSVTSGECGFSKLKLIKSHLRTRLG